MVIQNCITRFCERSYIGLNVFAFLAAFFCYFSMYGFRKGFTAAYYSGIQLFGIDFKILALTFQQVGYTLSKFLGIKFISELKSERRGFWIIVFITISEIALILFGFVPSPYSCFCMFLNGLPLGFIWGLVFSYLEGRRTTEILGSGMCVSFIVSSGAVKSVGSGILKSGIVNEFWMPATVGAIFFPLTLITVFLLECIPPPNQKDIESRTARVAMTGADRIRFVKIFFPGLFAMIIFYMFLTAYRDFRDNFAPELWAAFGYESEPSIFTISEIVVAIVVIIPIALFMLIKEKIRIFISYHILILCGQVLVLLCSILVQRGNMSGLVFMVTTGVGLYVGYVPFNSIIFDLFIATFRYPANSGFLQYLSDSFGYLAAVIVLFIKNFASPNLSWLNFFCYISYAMSGIGLFTILVSLFYYIYKYKKWNTNNLIHTSERVDQSLITSSQAESSIFPQTINDIEQNQ